MHILVSTVLRLICTFITFYVITTGQGQAAESNVALIVANSQYSSGSLRDVVPSAKLIAEELERKGFEVVFETNPTFFRFQSLISDYGVRAAGASVSLFYYVGHAISLSKNNYLIPTDIQLKTRSDIRKLPWLQQVLIAGSEAVRSIVVLDTCRSSRFAAGWGDGFGRKALCPDNNPIISLSENTTLVFTASETISNGDRNNTKYASMLVSALDNSDYLIKSLIGEAEEPNSQKYPVSDRPTLFGNEKELGISDSLSVNNNTSNNSPLNKIESIDTGEYVLRNLFRSRLLADTGEQGPTMVDISDDDPRAIWTVFPASEQSRIFANKATGRLLEVSRDGSIRLARSANEDQGFTNWSVVQVDDGLDNEMFILNLGSDLYLRVAGSVSKLSLESASGNTGWLFERRQDNSIDLNSTASVDESFLIQDNQELGRLTVLPTPENSLIRILNIGPQYTDGIELPRSENYLVEVSAAGYAPLKRWIRLDTKELTVVMVLEPLEGVSGVEGTPRNDNTVNVETDNQKTTADNSGIEATAAAPSYNITQSDRNNALIIFTRLASAIRERNLEILQFSLPYNEKRQILDSLVNQYAEIDAQIFFLNSDDQSQSIYATIRLMRLKKANGDIVNLAASYRDFPIKQTRNPDGSWSGILWDEKYQNGK